MHITTFFEDASYRYSHHMGSGSQFPATARATDRKTGAQVEITSFEYPGLNQYQMIEKAIALLRNRFKSAGAARKR